MKLKIALLQLLSENNLTDQYEKGKEACRQAKELGANIALFPEMWSNGYYLPQTPGSVDKFAITKDDDFIKGFSGLAKELQMAIAITFLEKNDPKPLNSVIVFDRCGNEVLHYSKVHTCDFDLEKVLSGG